MDYSDIESLFTEPSKLKKFCHKRWVEIHPVNTVYENAPIKYDCKTIQDKLVNYHDGYILLNVTVKNHHGDDGVSDLANNADVAPKGSHSFIDRMILEINNVEVENLHDVFLFTEMQNQLEYSHDYGRIAKQFLYAQDTTSGVTSSGHTTRKNLIPAVANNQTTFNVKIPLGYMSNFLRTIDFPLINQLISLEVTYRQKNAVLGTNGATVAGPQGDALDVTINHSSLFLPIVELPMDENAKLVNRLKSKSLKKKVIWNRMNNITLPNELVADAESSHQIEPSVDGLRKLYVIPRTNFNYNQLTVDLHTAIELRNINIVIDSEDFYQQNIKTQEEAYELVSENFNNGGKDFNTGSLLDYTIFLKQNRFYVFDLSRQRVFESNPRKSQSVRFRCTPSANCRLKFFIAQEKETIIDFVNPLNTKTI